MPRVVPSWGSRSFGEDGINFDDRSIPHLENDFFLSENDRFILWQIVSITHRRCFSISRIYSRILKNSYDHYERLVSIRFMLALKVFESIRNITYLIVILVFLMDSWTFLKDRDRWWDFFFFFLSPKDVRDDYSRIDFSFFFFFLNRNINSPFRFSYFVKIAGIQNTGKRYMGNTYEIMNENRMLNEH